MSDFFSKRVEGEERGPRNKPLKEWKTYALISQPHGTGLCQKCQVLSFDDRKIGASERTLPNGQAALGFNAAQDCKEVVLDYRHSDSYPGLPGLSASAKAGCPFRSLLIEALAERPEFFVLTKVPSDEIHILLAYHWSPQELRLRGDSPSNQRYMLRYLRVTVNILSCGKEVDTFELLCQAETENSETDTIRDSSPPLLIELGACATWLGLAVTLPPDAIHHGNLSMVRKGIKNCLRSCPTTPQKNYFLPARLLDLSQSDRPRLIQLPKRTSARIASERFIKYAALSYCWGTPEEAEAMPKLRADNLSGMLRGSGLSNLPPVFRDTIRVCGKLGIRYLWIDALCVMQENDSEFHAVSSQLRQIFRNAVLTIVALASRSCQEGYLTRSHIAVPIPYRSNIRKEVSGIIGLRCFPFASPGNREPSASEIHDDDLGRSRWKERGWTYIEDICNTRVVYFGDSLVHYACSHNVSSFETEDDPSEQHVHLGASYDMSYDIWMTISGSLSARRFTKPSDRFPALSALARDFAFYNDDTYLAGLWKKDLARGLTPMRTPTEKWETFVAALVKPRSYVAPSWSWASQAQYPVCKLDAEDLLEEKFELLGYRAEFVGKDPFGAIKSATLSLSARLAPLPATLRLDSAPSVWCPNWFVFVKQSRLGICALDWVTEISDTYPVPRHDLKMMLVTGVNRGRRDRNGKERAESAHGLILMPTGKGNEYWRIGGFSFYRGPQLGYNFSNDIPWDNLLFRGRKKQIVHLV